MQITLIESGAHDIHGNPVEHSFDILSLAREFEAPIETFVRFGSTIGRSLVIRAPHSGGAQHITSDLTLFTTDMRDGMVVPSAPVTPLTRFGISFFAVLDPNSSGRLETGPDSVVGLTIAGHRQSVLFDGSLIRGVTYTPDENDRIGNLFAAKVCESLGGNLEYVGHIPLSFVGGTVTEIETRNATLRAALNGSLLDAESFPPLAWVFNHMVVFPYDLPHYEMSGYFINAALMEAYRMISGRVAETEVDEVEVEEVDVAEDPSVVATRRATAIANTINSMVSWAKSHDDATAQNAIDNVTMVQNDIDRLHQQLVQKRALMRERMLHVDTIRAMSSAPSDLDLISFRRMMESGLITSAAAISGSRKLTFDTRELLAFDERTDAYHLIGRMRISIDMANGQVRFANLDRKVNAYAPNQNAPHVWSDGIACLGSFADSIPEFISRADWIGLVDASIQFIQTANINDSAGRHVHKWPFVEDPTKYGLPPYDGEVRPYGYTG